MALANLPGWPLVGAGEQFNQHAAAKERMAQKFPEVFGFESTIDLIALRNILRKAWTAGISNLRDAEWYLFCVRRLHDQASRIRSIRDVRELAGTLDREIRHERHALNVLEESHKKLERSPTAARASLANLVTIDEWRQVERAEPPPMTPLEYVLFFFQRNLRHACVCKNPDCSAPYFFRKRKGQEYCSPDCVAWGKRASNRISWKVHAKQWRSNARKKQPKRRKREHLQTR